MLILNQTNARLFKGSGEGLTEVNLIEEWRSAQHVFIIASLSLEHMSQTVESRESCFLCGVMLELST